MAKREKSLITTAQRFFHEARHNQMIALIHAYSEEHRALLGIEPAWTIVPTLLCVEAHEKRRQSDSLPEELPNAYMTWVQDTWTATLGVRCDLSLPDLEWEVLHELMELCDYRTGTIMHMLLHEVLPPYVDKDFLAYIYQEYAVARNQEINKKVKFYTTLERHS